MRLGDVRQFGIARFTGYDWQVVALSHDGKVTSIPARPHEVGTGR